MNVPDLKLFKSFVDLAQDGSFTRAAERLHMTQPALSLQIQRLESQLGFTLFRRSTRSAQLTPEGSQLLTAAARLLEECHNLDDVVRRLQFGGALKLHVGAAPYTSDFELRNAVIDRFILDHGEIPLAIHNGSQNELIHAVSRLEMDLAFIVGMRVPRAQYNALAYKRLPGEGIYPDDMRGVVLGNRPVELLVPEESPLAQMPTIPHSALRGQPIVMIACAEGRPLLEPIVHMLESAGATIVFPPEAHVQISVIRYGCLMRMLTVNLGWFDEKKVMADHRMVRRSLADCRFETDLVLLSAPENDKAAIEPMLRIAAQISRDVLAQPTPGVNRDVQGVNQTNESQQ